MALSVPCTRTSAASDPGGTTVSAITEWSYCVQTQARLQRLGLAIRRSSASARSTSGTAASAAGAGVGTQGRSYSGASSPSSLIGRLATSSPW